MINKASRMSSATQEGTENYEDKSDKQWTSSRPYEINILHILSNMQFKAVVFQLTSMPAAL